MSGPISGTISAMATASGGGRSLLVNLKSKPNHDGNNHETFYNQLYKAFLAPSKAHGVTMSVQGV